MNLKALLESDRVRSCLDWLPIVLLVAIFPIDSTWYVLSAVSGVPKLPIGFICFVLSLLLLLPREIAANRHFAHSVLGILAVMAIGVLAAALSPNFDYQWVDLFSWYLASFALGTATARSTALSHPVARRLIIGTTSICALICAAVLWNGWSNEFNYLRPASALTITGIFSLVLARLWFLRAAVFVGVLLALVALTSRTSLYLWLLVPVLGILIYDGERVRLGSWWKTLAFKAVVAVALTAVNLVVLLPTLAYFGDPRIAPTIEAEMSSDFGGLSIAPTVEMDLPSDFGDPRIAPPTEAELPFEGGVQFRTTDTSINARGYLLEKGWSQIVESPLFGGYKHYLSYGGEGGYIHSILSYWQQFGLVPFVALLVFLSWIMALSFAIPSYPAGAISKLLILTTLIAAVAARSHTSTEIYLAAGFVIGASRAIRPFRRWRALDDTPSPHGPKLAS